MSTDAPDRTVEKAREEKVITAVATASAFEP